MGLLAEMSEAELRARVAELELQVSSKDDNVEKDAEIEELRAAVNLYKAENRKLKQTASNAVSRQNSRRSSKGAATAAAPADIAALQSQVDDLQRANSHLQQSIAFKEKQLSSATAAATWAQSQLSNLVGRLQGLAVDVDIASGTRAVRRRSSSPVSRQNSAVSGEGLKGALAEVSNLLAAADQVVLTTERKVATLDIEGRLKELETQLAKWRASAERQRGEVEALEEENRELRERITNGGVLPREEGAARIVSPEVIRMPSHAAHSVNSDHWPVRSVASQTPRTEDLSAWGLAEPTIVSPRGLTPRSGRSAASHQWEPPSTLYTAQNTPPVTPQPFNSPHTHESPRIRRPASPAGRQKGIVPQAVLRRHLANSPFARGSTMS